MQNTSDQILWWKKSFSRCPSAAPVLWGKFLKESLLFIDHPSPLHTLPIFGPYHLPYMTRIWNFIFKNICLLTEPLVLKCFTKFTKYYSINKYFVRKRRDSYSQTTISCLASTRDLGEDTARSHNFHNANLGGKNNLNYNYTMPDQLKVTFQQEAISSKHFRSSVLRTSHDTRCCNYSIFDTLLFPLRISFKAVESIIFNLIPHKDWI